MTEKLPTKWRISWLKWQPDSRTEHIVNVSVNTQTGATMIRFFIDKLV